MQAPAVSLMRIIVPVILLLLIAVPSLSSETMPEPPTHPRQESAEQASPKMAPAVFKSGLNSSREHIVLVSGSRDYSIQSDQGVLSSRFSDSEPEQESIQAGETEPGQTPGTGLTMQPLTLNSYLTVIRSSPSLHWGLAVLLMVSAFAGFFFRTRPTVINRDFS